MTRKTPTGAEWARDLPERLVHRAADVMAEGADPGVVVAEVLRSLTRADCPKTITAIDIRFWANDAEKISSAPAPASQEGGNQ